jgi:hypothetical protein
MIKIITRFRWWLASVLVAWTFDLIGRDLTDDQLLRFEQFCQVFGENRLDRLVPRDGD